ncbi:unnamed protein product [Sphenostylis stenocarpa]|uniref:Uncharacterized protein n=1 Tax=Sphenostylis stenocarpa TaxID=92480 RepID=A0AA86TID3_9FABA|nr:unnamed protein product [Sphenostylis stenocarpa]
MAEKVWSIHKEFACLRPRMAYGACYLKGTRFDCRALSSFRPRSKKTYGNKSFSLPENWTYSSFMQFAGQIDPKMQQ